MPLKLVSDLFKKSQWLSMALRPSTLITEGVSRGWSKNLGNR
jgi:hypothetical protein